MDKALVFGTSDAGSIPAEGANSGVFYMFIPSLARLSKYNPA